MNEKFFDLKKEKQDRMINAALSVFAENGYRYASTDDIVRRAHISKGLLFHYFESKLGLYTFIYEYSVRYMKMELGNAVNPKETNFFAVYKQIEIAKLQILKNYPFLQMFLDKADTENVSEAILSIEERHNELLSLYEKIDAQVDLSIFPKKIDGNKIRRMLKYTVRDLMNDHLNDHSFNAEMLYEENISYLQLLYTLTTPHTEA